MSAARPNYSQLLRSIGQVLESLGVQSFVVTVEGDDFSVRGRKPHPGQEKSLRAIWRLLSGANSSSSGKVIPSSGEIELRYTAEDIARMDAEGRKRRKVNAPGEAPESYSTAQVLRSCGAFVDLKQGRILAVKKEDQNIAIDYESAQGEKTSHQFTVASLYDFYVKMYLKRKKR